jgi:hypothetical protein
MVPLGAEGPASNVGSAGLDVEVVGVEEFVEEVAGALVDDALGEFVGDVVVLIVGVRGSACVVDCFESRRGCLLCFLVFLALGEERALLGIECPFSGSQ